jgi:hypothetical protein
MSLLLLLIGKHKEERKISLYSFILLVYRFHAIDQPVVDPLAIRRAKSTTSLKKTPPKSPSSPKVKPPSKWIAFSKRDSSALEKAYQVR